MTASHDPSRRRFLVFMSGVAVGSFFVPTGGKAKVGIPSSLDIGNLPVDELPPDQACLELLSRPAWRQGIRPTDGETVDVLVYEVEGDRIMWWPADDEELAEMHRFYEATRTPGRPLVDPETIYPIERTKEEQRLLAAIVADLDADSPRLAYADWLDAQSDARGEFIRLQCSTDDASEREEELYEKYGKSWLLPLAALGLWPATGTKFDPALYFYRGMIERVHVWRNDVLPRHAERLWEAAPALRQLLMLCDLDIPGLVALPQLRQVTSIYFFNPRTPFTPADVQAMISSPNLGSLRELKFSDHFNDEMIAAFCGSRLLSQLHELDFHKCQLSAQAVTMLASSPNISSVTDLELGTADVDPIAARRMAESPYLRQLESLSFCLNDISRTRLNLDIDALRALLDGDWRNLKRLDVSKCRIGDEGARIIAAAPALKGLEYLNLENADITDDGVQAIVDSPHLNALNHLRVEHSPEMRELIMARLRKNAGLE